MSVRFDTTAHIWRTANLPTSTMTICGWYNRTAQNTMYDTIFAIGSDEATLNNNIYLGCWSSVSLVNFTANGTSTSLGFDLTNGQSVFMAFTLNGTGAGNGNAYLRTAAQNTLVYSANGYGMPSGTQAKLNIGVSNYDGTDFVNGRIWNVKCWNRVLTTAELLIESFYERVMFPASINFWYPLRSSSDLNDYSGNNNHPSSAGALSTEHTPWAAWKPGARIVHYIPPTGPQNALAWIRA